MFQTNRCGVCKTRRGTRFCLRIGRNICWHCCNEKRVDFKCPEACRYALQKQNKGKEGLFEFITNVDSKQEFNDLLENEIVFWIRNPQKYFDNKIPLEMIESPSEKKELEKFFGNLPIKNGIIFNILKKKLKLENIKSVPPEENHETTAMKYLDKIIEQDWDGTISFLYQNVHYAEKIYKENYIKRMLKAKIIKRMNNYDLLASALTKDKKRALVYFEINGKYEMTISLIFDKKKWKIENNVFGRPELYTGKTDSMKQLAVLLSENKPSQAYELLKKYGNIYFDSSELRYYWGMYYTFLRKPQKAKNFFFDAIEIEPNLLEAKYNYAYILHTENNTEDAKRYYREILEISPDIPKVLNNLAAIYIDEKKNEEAEELLERCLRIDENFEFAKKNQEKIKKMKIPPN